MCITELNLSLLPCRHRWFHLVKPCAPSTNLSTCSSKLALSGWEIKCDFCPFCSGWNNASEYRLIGNDSLAANPMRSNSVSLAAARHETKHQERYGSGWDSRRESIARSNSTTSITAITSEKNKTMNERVNAYFNRVPAPDTRTVPEGDESSDTSSEANGSIRRDSATSSVGKAGFFKKVKRGGKRMTMGMFK